MDNLLKQEIKELIDNAISELQALDAFLSAYYHETPDYRLNPSTAFMSAWNKAKTAKSGLLSINLDDETQ